MMNAHKQGGRRLMAGLVWLLVPMLAPSVALATNWASTEQGCYDAGFNTAEQATGGQWEGWWRCSNTSSGSGPFGGENLFPLDALASINGYINEHPDLTEASFEHGGRNYLLQSGTEEGVGVINVSTAGYVGGAFGEGAFTGSAETADLGIDGTGDPGSARFHTYSGYATSPPACPGDIDGDGDTDVFDFGLFASAFGSVAGAAGYDPDADINGDGAVDVFDFGVLAPDFGCEG